MIINQDTKYKNAILFGKEVNTDNCIFYDNFKRSPERSNPNTFVTGRSGTGKSIFFKVKSCRGTIEGNRYSIIFDLDGEYKQEMIELGGQNIELQAGEKSGINPFDLEIQKNRIGENKVNLYSKEKELVSIISFFFKEVLGKMPGAVLISILYTAIDSLYSQRGITEDPADLYIKVVGKTKDDDKSVSHNVKKSMPTLSDLREELTLYNKSKDLAELNEVMKMITGDGPMAIFDCQSTINFDENKLIAISLRHLPIINLAFYPILLYVCSKLSDYKLQDLYKDIYIENAELFIQDNFTYDFIINILKRSSKFHIAFNLATQSMENFMDTNYGRAIIDLCATKIIFRQEARIVQQIIDFLGLPENYHYNDENIKDFIGSAPTGQALLLGKKKPIFMNVTLIDNKYDFK